MSLSTTRPIVGFLMFLMLGACNKTNQETQTTASTDTVRADAQISKVIGVARIEPEKGIITITAGVNGKIVSILVAENEMVKKGQPLATLNTTVEQAQLQQAQSKTNTQKATIESAVANANSMKINADNAQENYLRNLKLYAEKALSKQNLDDSKAQLDKLKSDHNKAIADISQARNKLNEINADINFYKTNINEKQILAPYDAKILTLDAKIGDYVNASTPLGELAPTGNLIAITEVDELFADRIENGMKGEVFSQATGKSIGKGSVSFAADYLKKKSLFDDETAKEDRRVREIHLTLEPNAKPLINSRVDCKIYLKK